MRNITDKPLADSGLTSYRCKGAFGWIMIGAKDNEDAMREALRSSKQFACLSLQAWNGKEYAPC